MLAHPTLSFELSTINDPEAIPDQPLLSGDLDAKEQTCLVLV